MAALEQPQPQLQGPWPLYDLFLDVPFPGASKSCPPAFIIRAPSTGATNQDIDQELSKLVPQVALFAFPEYENTNNAASGGVVNRYDKYAMQPATFQNYTFSLQLQSGIRVHGHVRRYLPCHLVATTRYDIGRRGERALVILTRVTGADALYSAILKSVEGISALQAAMPTYIESKEAPQQSFLVQLHHFHQRVIADFPSRAPEKRVYPALISVPCLEVGTKFAQVFSSVDTSRFFLPPSVLKSTSFTDAFAGAATSSILPVLRCLGISNTLRFLCALLSERRIILVSASTTRLGACAKAGIAILAQGMLNWQHIYVPVLPPHLWQYLAAPYPYLVGILGPMATRLNQTDGLGEVLIINLDQNELETRGIPPQEIMQRIPDMLAAVRDPTYAGAPPQGAPEFLAQDLLELLKNDKKTLNGESAVAAVQETAAKATKAVKKTFNKLKQKYLTQKSSSMSSEPGEPEPQELEEAPEINAMAPDYIFTESCRNEQAEEEARVAFTAFFLSMYGDMRWYLSPPQNGMAPQLDRKRFLQQKEAMGERGTATWQLLLNFCQTQMLEEFVKARVEELRVRKKATAESSLFLQCFEFHQRQNIDFGVMPVRRVSQQISQASAQRVMQMTSARRMAMALTSKRNFEGDYGKALADLVEQCRESSSVLYDVMSTLWIRMRDNKGLQWKHALQSLKILRSLLFHGPLAAVSEATDGLYQIRALKYYNGNARTAFCLQVRASAAEVYGLLVDRARLFTIRRICLARRRTLQKQDRSTFSRDRRISFEATFSSLHAAMRPGVSKSTPVQQTMRRGASGSRGNQATPRQAGPPTSFAQSPQYAAQPTYAVIPNARPPSVAAAIPRAQAAAPVSVTQDTGDIFGLMAHNQVPSPQVPAAPSKPTNDLLGLFDDMTVSQQHPQPTSEGLFPPAAGANPAVGNNYSNAPQAPPLQPQGNPFGQVQGYGNPVATVNQRQSQAAPLPRGQPSPPRQHPGYNVAPTQQQPTAHLARATPYQHPQQGAPAHYPGVGVPQQQYSAQPAMYQQAATIAAPPPGGYAAQQVNQYQAQHQYQQHPQGGGFQQPMGAQYPGYSPQQPPQQQQQYSAYKGTTQQQQQGPFF